MGLISTRNMLKLNLIPWRQKDPSLVSSKSCKFFETPLDLTLLRMGFFGSAYGWEAKRHPPVSKTCHTNATIMKLGTVISYLKKIQKIYESRGTPLSSADISIFHWKSANFAVSKNADIDCILIHSF